MSELPNLIPSSQPLPSVNSAALTRLGQAVLDETIDFKKLPFSHAQDSHQCWCISHGVRACILDDIEHQLESRDVAQKTV